MAKRRKRGRWVWLLVALAAIVAFLFWPRKGANDAFLSAQVQRGEIATWYSFEGNVYAPRAQSLQAAREATVRAVYVREGQRVGKNDRLMRLSTGELLKADMAGEVVGLHVAEDDVVAAGGALIDLMDMDRLEVRIKVDEYDVPAVSVGKAALVTVNALEKEIGCRVESMAKQATQEGQTAYYLATLSLPDRAGVLPGMQVEARLINRQAEDALRLPMEALSFTERNEPFVLVPGPEGKGAVQKAVAVGINDGLMAEITEGLSEGDTVLYRPQRAVIPAGGPVMMAGPRRIRP
ncbi:efflux RND transporter periplasmic adaptor subunit [Bacillota bacterium Meth-B3]